MLWATGFDIYVVFSLQIPITPLVIAVCILNT